MFLVGLEVLVLGPQGVVLGPEGLDALAFLLGENALFDLADFRVGLKLFQDLLAPEANFLNSTGGHDCSRRMGAARTAAGSAKRKEVGKSDGRR